MHSLVALAGYLRRNGLLVVTAESCTAGLIAARLADEPGCGSLLDSAFVVYSPGAKQRELGLTRELLATHNLTSEPVARAMAEGALARVPEATLAISNTGVADDGGEGVEPGTQCFGWSFRRRGAVVSFTETARFGGDRAALRARAAEFALLRVFRYHALAWRAG
ncbi:CinA family protein [Derxia gummosa]|uniref:CinA family protein n=1 Tax=Derxia gummosa DSM 723 TaxID=1121388 RepID=A0A8B6X1A4_9BURK|nr:nicotinamide-nucleotide amidohydrolase family protein [Derxia gummosa]